jgi:hypothetical protein
VWHVPKLVTGLLMVLMVGGCDVLTGDPAPTPETSPEPRVAAVAGGACQLMDFEVIEESIGVTFEVSAAAQQEATYTCVLQKATSSLPDLLLIVTPTAVDTPMFRNDVMPAGATLVTGLGKVGYRAVGGAGAGRGPIAEVSWLSGNNRLMTLRYTSVAGTTPADANDVAVKLVELAKKIDQIGV